MNKVQLQILAVQVIEAVYVVYCTALVLSWQKMQAGQA